MNFDTYFAIVHPMFHKTKVTKGRIVKCLIVVWLFTGAMVVAYVFYPFDLLVKLPFCLLWLRLFLSTPEYILKAGDLLKPFEGQTQAVHLPRVKVLRNQNENNIFTI